MWLIHVFWKKGQKNYLPSTKQPLGKGTDSTSAAFIWSLEEIIIDVLLAIWKYHHTVNGTHGAAKIDKKFPFLG